MARGLVLTSLGELAQVRELFADDGPVPEARALVPVIQGTGPDELESLAATARQALDELQELLASDGQRRREAEQGSGRASQKIHTQSRGSRCGAGVLDLLVLPTR